MSAMLFTRIGRNANPLLATLLAFEGHLQILAKEVEEEDSCPWNRKHKQEPEVVSKHSFLPS
jgi:hypothetical protein